MTPVRLPDRSRLPRLPERPVRTALRFLWRAALAWVGAGLDLERRPPPETRPRSAKDVKRGQ